jgi:Flp pilus assembly protein CpaB
MTLRTVLIVVLALVFGVAAAVYATNAVTRSREAAAPERVDVVYTLAPVPRGAALSKATLAQKSVLKEDAPADALHSPEEADGRIAELPLAKDDLVREAKLAKKGTNPGMASLMRNGMQAATILTPTASSGVGGFIRPGDKVDVLLTVDHFNPEDQGGTVRLMQQVEVLATDTQLEAAPSTVEGQVKDKSGRQEMRFVTLLVEPKQAQILADAQKRGTLTLSLRHPEDTKELPSDLVTRDDLKFPRPPENPGRPESPPAPREAQGSAPRGAPEGRAAAGPAPGDPRHPWRRHPCCPLTVRAGQGADREATAMQAFVVSDNDELGAKVRRALLRHGQDCPAANLLSLDLATTALTLERPDLVVVILSPQPERAMGALADLRAMVAARLLAVGPASDPKVIRRAYQMGASDYIDEDDFDAELSAALGRAQGSETAAAESGRTIVVLGPSGGCGASTLAANLATVLAREHKRALLVDLKLEAGDLAALLDVRPTYTLRDLCENVARLDRAIFERCLVHHDSGVHLLAPPRSIADTHAITAEGVRQAIALGRNLYPYVIVDLDHSFREEQLQTLRQADLVLLVMRLDFTALRNTQRTLEFLEQTAGVSRERVRLVVNRYGQPTTLTAAKAEEALGLKISHYIPDDPKTINRANNNGVPVVLESPSAKVSRSVTQLAGSLNGKPKK